MDQTTPMLRAASMANRLPRTDQTLDVESAEFQVVEQHVPAETRHSRKRLLAVCLSVILGTMALLAGSSLLTGHAGETDLAPVNSAQAKVASTPPLPSAGTPLEPATSSELAVTQPAAEASPAAITTPEVPAQRSQAKPVRRPLGKHQVKIETRRERRVTEKRSVRSPAIRRAPSSSF